YTAISYQWGADLKPFEIQTPEGPLFVTASLNFALRHIRDSTIKILVWVDAICINQLDDYERKIQVRRMKDIYRSAENVFAYIGEESDRSSEALETLAQIRTAALQPTLGHRTLRRFLKLLSRGWFRRAWVTQELVLAK
ncbi:heterokaryon incompatibility, partial [Lasiosphaeris hirsuta]